MYQVYSLDKRNNKRTVLEKNLPRTSAALKAGQRAKQNPGGHFSYEKMPCAK